MEVLFIKDVPNIAKRGDIKNVSAGYLRNFLLPRKLAIPVTKNNLKLVTAEKKIIERQKNAQKRKLEAIAEQIEGISLTFEVAVGEGGKMFGAVTSGEIWEELKKKVPDIEKTSCDKHTIVLKDPIKETGAYTVTINLHPEVKANLKIWVIEKK